MSFRCPDCDFTARFESALTMHRQLHHGTPPGTSSQPDAVQKMVTAKSMTIRDLSPVSSYTTNKDPPGMNLSRRTSSATRLLGILRQKLSRSKSLATHPEEPLSVMRNRELYSKSDCTSKALKEDTDSSNVSISTIGPLREDASKEVYSCHLCSFDADRITVLDRHLLNHHKIGLDNLLKLVLAKTKDGLTDDTLPPFMFTGLRVPYYKPIGNDVTEDGEFIVERVKSEVKVMKHASVNTDLKWTDIPDLRKSCRMMSEELDQLVDAPVKQEKEDLLDKMQTLNECMCKFVNSSKNLKKALTREKDSEARFRWRQDADDAGDDYSVGDPETSRLTRLRTKAHSERLERYNHRYGDKFSFDSSKKPTAESYYF